MPSATRWPKYGDIWMFAGSEYLFLHTTPQASARDGRATIWFKPSNDPGDRLYDFFSWSRDDGEWKLIEGEE